MTEANKWYKRFVGVNVIFDTNGRVRPTEIIWDSTHRFEIDRVVDVVSRPARKAGGQGDCYTVLIKHGDRLI